ncbi:hypothetical protein BDR22DRAFT_656299 [Usnea florida]
MTTARRIIRNHSTSALMPDTLHTQSIKPVEYRKPTGRALHHSCSISQQRGHGYLRFP